MAVVTLAILGAIVAPVEATPEFGRRYKARSCTVCHTVVPALNERGLDFLFRGYRPNPDLNLERHETVPLSVWLTQRADNHAQDQTNFFPTRAEIVAGDALNDQLSYFIEWRLVSLETRGDGSLRDRSGRFEDLWMAWSPDEEQRWTFTFGQFRPLLQLDAGRRLSISEPAILATSLEGSPSKNRRLQSLRSFNTAGRSPGVAVTYQSVLGELASDGLFHTLSLPMSGEFSIPLNAQAGREASFQFETRLKGVMFETFYRQGLSSLGVHVFVDHNRWMATALGEYNSGDFYLTAGLGVDQRQNLPARVRSSLQLEYLPTLEDGQWRPGLGFRVEDVSGDNRAPAYIPYIVLSSPNEEGWTTLLQLEYRSQKGEDRLQLDLSIMF